MPAGYRVFVPTARLHVIVVNFQNVSRNVKYTFSRETMLYHNTYVYIRKWDVHLKIEV